MSDFSDRTYLFDCIDGIFASDGGCASSGIRDEVLKRNLAEHLAGLDQKEFNALMSDYVVEHFLGPKARAHGYTFEDVVEFVRWLEREMEIDL